MRSIEVLEYLQSSSIGRSFDIRSPRLVGNALDFEVHAGKEAARIVVPLPDTGGRQPWLYAPAKDEYDWSNQLMLWISEEVETGGLGASRERRIVGGESYVTITPYGWKLASEREHQKLLKMESEDPV